MDAHSSVTALCCIGVAWQYIVYSVLAPVVPAFQAHEIWPFHTGRWPVSESIRCGGALVWWPLPPPPRAGEAIGPDVAGVELAVEEAPEPPPPPLLLLAAAAMAACCCAIRSRCLSKRGRFKKIGKKKKGGVRYAVQSSNPQLFLSLSQQSSSKKEKKERSKGGKKERRKKEGKRTGSSTLAAVGSASPPLPASSARAGPSSGSIPSAPRLWLASRVGSEATVPNADTVAVVVVVDLRHSKVEVEEEGVRAAWPSSESRRTCRPRCCEVYLANQSRTPPLLRLLLPPIRSCSADSSDLHSP